MSTPTFLWHDYETFGAQTRRDRPAQFAAIRTDAALNDGDLAVTTDYRAVLADVLTNRCGASTSEVANVLPGFTGATLGVTRARA